MTDIEERPGEDDAEAIQNSADQSEGNHTPTAAGDGVSEYEAKIAALLNGANPAQIERNPPLVEDHQHAADVRRLEDAYIGSWIAAQHLQDYLFSGVFGWMEFDGWRWRPVTEAVVAEKVCKTLIGLHNAAAKAQPVDTDLLKRLSGLLSANKVRAITYIAKLRRTTTDEFDRHPDLLNVRNGVVDLRDGTLRPPDRTLMLTKVTPVDYVPGAVHDDWNHALGALPDNDAATWLQVRLGQGITGHQTPDDRLVVLKGSGENGKTTIIDSVRTSVGADHAIAMPERVLLARTGDHPTELMELRGARLAFMEEFPELGHLNVKRLKDLHGTGVMSARYCGKDTVHWPPTHTAFVSTNYLPRVDESDHGTWRRLVLVDFRYRYRRPGENSRNPFDRVSDPNLRERLRAGRNGQHEAVLAWLVAGAVQWYRHDRRMPEDPQCIREATEKWRKSADLLMRYMDDRLVFDPAAHVASTELFEDFSEWLRSNGHRPWSDQNFTARFGQHEEVTIHNVAKKVVRQSRPGLSRPAGKLAHGATGGKLPKQFTGWLSVRFRTDGDSEENPDDQG